VGRKRRVICGFIGGSLFSLALKMQSPLHAVACVVVGVAFIVFGAISDKRLNEIKEFHKKEWFEKDWEKEEEKWR